MRRVRRRPPLERRRWRMRRRERRRRRPARRRWAAARDKGDQQRRQENFVEAHSHLQQSDGKRDVVAPCNVALLLFLRLRMGPRKGDSTAGHQRPPRRPILMPSAGDRAAAQAHPSVVGQRLHAAERRLGRRRPRSSADHVQHLHHLARIPGGDANAAHRHAPGSAGATRGARAPPSAGQLRAAGGAQAHLGQLTLELVHQQVFKLQPVRSKQLGRIPCAPTGERSSVPTAMRSTP